MISYLNLKGSYRGGRKEINFKFLVQYLKVGNERVLWEMGKFQPFSKISLINFFNISYKKYISMEKKVEFQL